MTTFLFILLVLACFIIIGAVLLQPAKSGASALGGTSSSIFGSTGGTTFLFRLTMACAFFIMVSCLFLSWNKIRIGKSSFVDQAIPGASSTPLTNPTAPLSNPTAPLSNPTAPLTATPAPQSAATPAAPTTATKTAPLTPAPAAPAVPPKK